MRNIFLSLTAFLYFLKQVNSNAQDNVTFNRIANVRNVADQKDSFPTGMNFSWEINTSLEDTPMEDKPALGTELHSEAQLESQNCSARARNSKAHSDHPLKFETVDNFYKWKFFLFDVKFEITAPFNRLSNQPIIEFATNASTDGQSIAKDPFCSTEDEPAQVGQFQIVNKSTDEFENIEFYYCGNNIAVYYHSRSIQSLFHSEFFGIEIDTGIMKYVSILYNSTCYCHFLLDNGDSIYIVYDENNKTLNVEIASMLRVKLKRFKGFFARKTYCKGNATLKMNGKVMIITFKDLSKLYRIDSNLLYLFPMQT